MILRAGPIGDTLMVTPLVRALRRTFPNAYLGFICSQTAYDVLRYNPNLDEVLTVENRHLPIWLSRDKREIVRRSRELNLDAVLSLESHRDFTKLACTLNSARVISLDASYQQGVEQVLPVPTKHAVELYLTAGERLGVKPDGLSLEVHLPPEAQETIQKKLGSHGIGREDLVVGLHSGWGGRAHHPTETRLRSWPADRFAEVVRWLVEQMGARVVLTGAAIDRPVNEFIAKAARVPVVDLAGQLSVIELMALLRRLNLYIAVDSGPGHLAAALGTPLLTIWGPANFESISPIAGAGPVRILREPPPCAPCYGTPLMKTCQDNICMKQISVADVTTNAEEMLTAQLATHE